MISNTSASLRIVPLPGSPPASGAPNRAPGTSARATGSSKPASAPPPRGSPRTGPGAGAAAGLGRPEPRPRDVGPGHGLVEARVGPPRRRFLPDWGRFGYGVPLPRLPPLPVHGRSPRAGGG